MKQVKSPKKSPWTRCFLATALLVGLGSWPAAHAQDADPASEQDRSPPAEARAMDPELETAFFQAMALMRDGKFKEAEAAFMALYKEHPDEPNVRKQLSLIKIQDRDYAAALELIEPLLRQERNDYVVLNNAAWIYATVRDKRLRNSARAITLAQEAILLAPNNYHVWSTLAEAYYADGRFDKAKEASDAALSLARKAELDAGTMVEFRQLAEKIDRAVRALSLIE